MGICVFCFGKSLYGWLSFRIVEGTKDFLNIGDGSVLIISALSNGISLEVVGRLELIFDTEFLIRT